MERRYFQTSVSLIGEGETPKKITGYAALFNKMSLPLPTRNGTFRERIAPGAFDVSGDIVARYNHELVLGRSSAGTVTLSVDDIGLRYEISPSKSMLTQHVVEAVERGDVKGSSFAFDVLPGGEAWRVENGERIRELRNIFIRDVGPVDFPAYPDTASDGASVAMRSEDVAAEIPEPEPETVATPEPETAPEPLDIKPLKPRYD